MQLIYFLEKRVFKSDAGRFYHGIQGLWWENGKNLKQTAENALKQIEEKNYEADLLAAGIPAAKICKLGFAFQGKEVLVLKAEL